MQLCNEGGGQAGMEDEREKRNGPPKKTPIFLKTKKWPFSKTKRKNGHKNGRFKGKQRTRNGQAKKKKVKKWAGL